MSIIEQAKQELARANFGQEDSRVMVEILEKFFDQWDSGGAVCAVAPVLQRLIAGKDGRRLPFRTGRTRQRWALPSSRSIRRRHE